MKKALFAFSLLGILPFSSCTPSDVQQHLQQPFQQTPGDGSDQASRLEVNDASGLRHALRTATPGTIINLHSGIYYGEFDVEVSGEEGHYITIRGPVDRSAILDGNNSVSSWQGVLNLESRHHVIVENLEIRNSRASRYGVLVGATSTSARACDNIQLRNLHVHHAGEEIIKIQGRNTHDILVENCLVHTNLDWSGIDVQGHWGGTPPYDQKPRRVVIRNNLIYDINRFAGIGNEFADNIHAYNNVILGSTMGLDIGCGNYNLIHNNLITSYEHFNSLLADGAYTAIDISHYDSFSAAAIDALGNPECLDGIALSGNYMSLVFDNEITDCTRNGDMILSYDHWIGEQRHNYDYEKDIDYGHRSNLFFRNRIHDNRAYYTVREYNKQEDGISYDEIFFNNIFYENDSSRGLIFEHSEGLMFFNNTIVNGDGLDLSEQSTNALIKNNIFLNSGYEVSGDSSGGETISSNHETTDPSIFIDPSHDDYHLDSSGENACIDRGENLGGTLATRFQTFHDLRDTEFGHYADFDIEFDFLKDLDGNPQEASWDIGAFVSP